MKRKNRLVFVWNYLSWGGAQIYLFSIIKVAMKTWDVLVILPKGSAPDLIRLLDELGVEYRFVEYHLDVDPATTLGRKLARQLTRIKVEYAMYKTLLDFDVRDTVFHIDIAPWQSVAFLTAMSIRRAKVFVSIHNFLPDAPWWRKVIWKIRFRFDSYLPGLNFITSNNDTKKRLRGWVTDKFWDRIPIAVTSIDTQQIADASSAPFDRAKALQELGVRPEDFVVLCVAQFIDRKGRWIFLEAARELMKTTTGITFVWLTPRLPSSEDQERIDAYGLGEKFRLVLSETVGTTRVDVLTFFRVADVFVLASYVEGVPGAVLEAMALGRPSISTNVYAIPEAVKHLETGILIEPGDPKALARAIVTLRDDRELRERLARDGREFILQNFDDRNCAASAIAAYEEALGNVI